MSKKRKTPNDANETSPADENYLAKNKECFNYGNKGHFRAQCPKLKGRRGGNPPVRFVSCANR